ncbi:MAG: transcriptional regulator [Smithellaceae bacterium]
MTQAKENSGNIQKKLVRLGRMLRVFMEQEKVSSSALSEILQTTVRTIQRDILFLKAAGFPVKETARGMYALDKSLLKHFEVFDDTELALVVALKNLVFQLGQPFQNAADGLFNRLYDVVMAEPVFVKIDESVPLDSRLLSRIVNAICMKKQGRFQYTVFSPYEVIVEPYKVVYFDGFWYLVGRDIHDGELKRYALDKIKDFKATKTCFKCIPAMLDSDLKNSANVWFAGERTMEILILVDQSCADYFKRRKIFPTQEIREEKSDGSLIVSFLVGNYGEIRNILKAWLPNVKILTPEELKQDFIADMKGWLRWQVDNNIW